METIQQYHIKLALKAVQEGKAVGKALGFDLLSEFFFIPLQVFAQLPRAAVLVIHNRDAHGIAPLHCFLPVIRIRQVYRIPLEIATGKRDFPSLPAENRKIGI